MPLEIREMVIKTNVVQRMEASENPDSEPVNSAKKNSDEDQLTTAELAQFKEDLLVEIPSIIERILAQQMRNF